MEEALVKRDELPEGDMDEMTKEILNFFEEDK